MDPTLTALRTPQIDAYQLDEDFQSYNWELFSSLFRYSSSHLIHSLKHEFQLFLRLLTAANTIFSSSSFATIGQQILQIKYSTSPMNRRQTFIYVSSLFLSYLHEKFLVDHRRLYAVQIIYVSMKLLNFLVFLHQGKYLNIFERSSDLSTCHNHPPSLRILDYTYVKRELIWHTMNETLASFIPFLTSPQSRTWIRKSFNGRFLPFLTQTDQCSVCFQSIVMPHQSTGQCQHYFCYYCAYTLIQQSCPICFKTIPGIRPRIFLSD